MLLSQSLWLLCLTAISARAVDTTDYVSVTGTYSTLSTVPTSDFTGSQYVYVTETSQSTVTSSLPVVNGTSATTATGTASSDTGNAQSTRTEGSQTQVIIGGSTPTTTSNSTASSTSSSAAATNTVPCNNYPEFCNRKYSNITEVCAHNSAFDIKNNAASNQQLSVTDQLDDGVRMLQGETHWVNDTVYNCHTSCDLLNAGTWQSELETLVTWLESNPYNVVTFLIVNSDFVDVTNYVSAVENSGLIDYVYEPIYVPQHRDQWPTLGEMILSGKRVVLFMDYNANQTAVPYILDEFTHIFETPFSPTNRSFPCTEQRPPGLNLTLARENYMYLANHNLNTAVDLSALTGGSSDEIILIPNTADINVTNGEYDQYSQLGAMSLNCTADWGRPPNFLLVDYYNIGIPGPGSVFEVAAQANGVTYNRKCCGTTTSAAPSSVRSGWAALAVAMISAVLLTW